MMTPEEQRAQEKPKKSRKRAPVPKSVPTGDTTILPVGRVRISKKEVDEALSDWDNTFPDLAGLLDAEVEA